MTTKQLRRKDVNNWT